MSRTLTKEDDPGMVEVRREDQQRINKFAACNRRMKELSEEERTLKVRLAQLVASRCIYLAVLGSGANAARCQNTSLAH